MEKKALAYQKYNDAAMAEMLIQILPEIAGKIAEPLSQIDKITIIGGEGSGLDGVSNNVPAVMAKLFESMKETTGIDLKEIVRAGSYDAKVNRNLNVSGLTLSPGASPTEPAQEEDASAKPRKIKNRSLTDRFSFPLNRSLPDLFSISAVLAKEQSRSKNG